MRTTALRSFQFCPHLGLDGAGTIASNKAEVSEEHRHEDRAPEDLVDGDLAEDLLEASALDLRVEPVVEVVAAEFIIFEEGWIRGLEG